MRKLQCDRFVQIQSMPYGVQMKIQMWLNGKNVFDRTENIVGKEKKVLVTTNFFLLTQCFQKLS